VSFWKKPVNFLKKLFGGKSGARRLRSELTHAAKSGDTLREQQLGSRLLAELNEFEAFKASEAKAKRRTPPS